MYHDGSFKVILPSGILFLQISLQQQLSPTFNSVAWKWWLCNPAFCTTHNLSGQPRTM